MTGLPLIDTLVHPPGKLDTSPDWRTISYIADDNYLEWGGSFIRHTLSGGHVSSGAFGIRIQTPGLMVGDMACYTRTTGS